MNNVWTELESCGVNRSEVMERFVNDEAFYLTCLCAFMTDSSFSDLKAALDNHDFKAAFQSAHTLKGVSANLGLKSLYRAICELVEPLRHEENHNYRQRYEAILVQKAAVQTLLNENGVDIDAR